VHSAGGRVVEAKRGDIVVMQQAAQRVEPGADTNPPETATFGEQNRAA